MKFALVASGEAKIILLIVIIIEIQTSNNTLTWYSTNSYLAFIVKIFLCLYIITVNRKKIK